MLTIKTIDSSLEAISTESFACFVESDITYSKEMTTLFSSVFPGWKEYLKKIDFSGQVGRTALLTGMKNKKVFSVLLVGLGAVKKSDVAPMELVRRAMGTLVRMMKAHKIKDCSVQLPPAKTVSAKMSDMVLQASVAGYMAEYLFDEFKTKKDTVTPKNRTVFFLAKKSEQKELQKSIDQAAIVSEGVNQARYWIDLPPSNLTPAGLADKAKTIAKKHGLKITVFNEDKVNAMGMGGLGGVAAGSDQDCKFIILEYKAKKKTADTIAFVGKGITFDSGGLILKPRGYIETMKEDMSGAAAVINAMQVVAQLKPDVNIVGLTPVSENMLSGKATKPGDILKFYNGKTAEILDTDAEGRLVLADALAYAVKHYKPAAIIDLATLTGACAHALGPFYSGLMTNNDAFAKKVANAAKTCGEKVWRLPFDSDYEPAIKSEVADIINLGSRKYLAGTVTAGLFLQHFVDGTPWVHVDIAGTAFNVPDISYYSSGGTGVGVRLLVDIAMQWS